MPSDNSPRKPTSGAFTLIEFSCVIVILAVLILVVVVPIATRVKPQQRARQTSCGANLRQIGMAFLMYRQDWDDALPPGTVRDTGRDGKPIAHNWAITRPGAAGLLQPYTKDPTLFRCPEASEEATLTYLYNDLAALAPADTAIVAPTRTILVAEGEEITENVGHAWEPSAPPQPATFDRHGRCPPGRGATLQNAPKRHDDGANYLLADGHTRWLYPRAVFFPPRATTDTAHQDAKGKAIGPDPNGDMRFEDRKYAATFHLR